MTPHSFEVLDQRHDALVQVQIAALADLVVRPDVGAMEWVARTYTVEVMAGAIRRLGGACPASATRDTCYRLLTERRVFLLGHETDARPYAPRPVRARAFRR